MTYCRARAHAAHLPAVGAVGPGGAGADAERAGPRAQDRRGRREVLGTARGRPDRPRLRRRLRASSPTASPRPMNADERAVRRVPPEPRSSRSTATSSRVSCASGSCARSSVRRRGADQHDDMTMICSRKVEPAIRRRTERVARVAAATARSASTNTVPVCTYSCRHGDCLRSHRPAAQPCTPDVIIVNARVLTVDPPVPAAEAIAICGDRIARVGQHRRGAAAGRGRRRASSTRPGGSSCLASTTRTCT